ncbi:heavy-metal-associated domain-containing protein [Oscillatoria sp. CS-180]|uniref:heavy-metal-associated domain-containing protein n=1 Tax=Oscillatoria sp. CS-180 TaxID=3021720 RepID=UPI00232EA20A|nr:heavy-metal-associated domain-containing protein [Oscillatoria sp. CS-180]MDB9526045.1 heavy-metal-associated domain-containing protein [Oscillatoria sp. CS-180]
MTTLNLTIPDMACSACADTITKSVHALDAAAVVNANTETKAVTISTTSDPTQVKQAIADAGYTVEAG